MERVKFSRVEVYHGDSPKKFPVYEIYLDGGHCNKKYHLRQKLRRWCHAGRKFTSKHISIITNITSNYKAVDKHYLLKDYF